MAYSDQAALAVNGDFITRVAACAAAEAPKTMPPQQWANANVWWIAASPGFGDAYASALAGNVADPGNDPSVISDAQILSAVQALLNEPAV